MIGLASSAKWGPYVISDPCQCGHTLHAGRCGRPVTGCPCSEYTPAVVGTPPPEKHPYYQEARK